MVNNSCIAETPTYKAVLESVGLGTNHQAFVDYSTILPYLADYLYDEGLALRNVDVTPEQLTDIVSENSSKLVDVVKDLVNTKNNMKFCEFDEVRKIVNNRNTSEGENEFHNLVNVGQFQVHNISSDTEDKIYEDLKFQLVQRVRHKEINKELRDAYGYRYTGNRNKSEDVTVPTESAPKQVKPIETTPVVTTISTEPTAAQQLNQMLEQKLQKETKQEWKGLSDYTVPLGNTTLTIQQSRVDKTMSVQERNDAVKNLAKWFVNFVDRALAQDTDRLLQKKGINDSLDKVKAAQEEVNRDMFERIAFEEACDKPNQEIINSFRDKIIPLTELDMIKMLGVRGIATELKKFVDSKPELKLISDNFDALFLEAASIINSKYNLNITGNFENYDAIEDMDDASDPTNSDGGANTSPENNYIRSDDRSRSTESSLSQDIKRSYDKCIIRDASGNPLKDSFGYNQTIDTSVAHSAMLKYTQNIIDFSDMMEMIRNSEESWINSTNPDGSVRKGCLRYLLENDEQLANSFYYNYKGSAQQNGVIQRGKDGKLRIISINEVNSSDAALKTATSNIESGNILNNLSIYDSKGHINKANIAALKQKINSINTEGKFSQFSADTFQDLVSILNSLGFSTSSDFNILSCIKNETEKFDPTDRDLMNVVKDFLNICGKICNDAEKIERADTIIIKEFQGYYKKLAKFMYVGEKELAESSSTEGGKTYNTYGKTNYIDELFKRLKQVVKGKKTVEGKDYYETWLRSKFGDSAFFKFNGVWLSDWLDKLANNRKYRETLERVNVIDSNASGVKTEYTKWDETISTLNNFLAYYNGPDDKLPGDGEKAAYYRMTIASNSPAGDYIKFVKYVGTDLETYEQQLLPKLWQVCKQELIRMNDVASHLQKRIDGTDTTPNIASYDAALQEDGRTLKTAGGLAFCLLPRLNYAKVSANNTILSKIAATDPEYRDKLIGKGFLDVIKDLDTAENRTKYGIEEADLEQFFGEVYIEDFNKDFTEEYEHVRPMLLKEKQFVNLEKQGKLEEAYREFALNYNFAFTQMVQLTCTDMAFFGNKTVEEVSSPADADFRHTFKVNDSTVTKYYRITADNALDVFQKRNKEYHAPTKKLSTAKKTHFREVTVGDIKIMSTIIDNVKAAVKNNKYMSSTLKKNIIAAFEEINVADGQSYRSLRSYMEVLEAAGKLDEETKECFNAILNGKIDDGIYYKVALALKPYFYGTIRRDRDTTDANGNPYVAMSPTQHKNSEYPLMVLTIAAGALGESKLLKGIDKFMADNNIDVIHFDSVVKVGLAGKLNLPLNLTSVPEIADNLKQQITDTNGKEINVDTVNIEDWGAQTDKPEHLVDKEQLIGSQPRRMVLADIPDTDGYTITVRGQVTKNGKTTIKNKEYTKEAFTKEYQELISKELIDKFSQVNSMFSDIRVLSRFLQDSVATSNKYDDDMMRMFSINEEGTGFVLPFWDATVANKVDELLNALVRNRIVKQYIKGGAVVQTAAVGLTNKLNVRYRKKDANGNYHLIPTFNEWLSKNPNGTREQYENTEAKDAVVAYMECYLPLWSKDLMDKYIVDGRIVDDNFPEALRYLVGYRVPTEDHYSMAPLKVVGFLSPSEGSSIVLPADITAIAGSDFDIDVMYLMIPEHRVHKYDMVMAKADYASTEGADLHNLVDVSEDTINSHNAKYEKFNRWFNVNKDKYLLPKEQWIFNKVEYDTDKTISENNSKQRHNRFIDMVFAAITSQHSLEKFTNPQNFDPQKLASRLCGLNAAGYSYETLVEKIKGLDSKKQIKYLDALVAATNKMRNISSPKVATDLHQQNMIGNELVGIFAVGNALQQIFEYFPLQVTKTFTINGNRSNGSEFTLGRQRNADGQLITKALAGYLGASVDNGKDPIMKDLVANPNTSKYIIYLTMLGYNPLEVGAFMNIPSIKSKLLNDGSYTKQDPKTWSQDFANDFGKAMQDEKVTNLTINEMMRAVREPDTARTEAVNLIALNMLDNIEAGADMLSRRFSQLLRVDSTNGNVSKSTLSSLRKVITAQNLLKSYAAAKKKGDLFIFEPIKTKTNPSGQLLPLMYHITTNLKDIEFDIQTAVLPYLQAFNSCALTASIKWMDDYTLYSNAMNFIETYINKDNWSETKQEQVFRKFTGEFQMFSLLNTPIFGKEMDKDITYSDKMKYYTKRFPAEFAEWQRTLPEELKENAFLKNILYVEKNKDAQDENAHLKNADFGTSKYARKQIKQGFNELMNINPDMAIKLFVYSAYKYGLPFNPQGWCHLVSSEAKIAIPQYVESVFDLKQMSPSPRFIEWFIRNNYRTINGLIASFGKETAKLIERYQDANLSDEEKENIIAALGGLPEYFKIDNTLYHKAWNEESRRNEYTILPGLGHGPYYHEYSDISIFDQDKINTMDNSDDTIDDTPPVQSTTEPVDILKTSITENMSTPVKTDKQPMTPSESDKDSTGQVICGGKDTTTRVIGNVASIYNI